MYYCDFFFLMRKLKFREVKNPSQNNTEVNKWHSWDSSPGLCLKGCILFPLYFLSSVCHTNHDWWFSLLLLLVSSGNTLWFHSWLYPHVPVLNVTFTGSSVVLAGQMRCSSALKEEWTYLRVFSLIKWQSGDVPWLSALITSQILKRNVGLLKLISVFLLFPINFWPESQARNMCIL